MIDQMSPEIALLCLGLMILWAVGLLVFILRGGGKQKNEEE